MIFFLLIKLSNHLFYFNFFLIFAQNYKTLHNMKKPTINIEKFYDLMLTNKWWGTIAVILSTLIIYLSGKITGEAIYSLTH